MYEILKMELCVVIENYFLETIQVLLGETYTGGVILRPCSKICNHLADEETSV